MASYEHVLEVLDLQRRNGRPVASATGSCGRANIEGGACSRALGLQVKCNTRSRHQRKGQHLRLCSLTSSGTWFTNWLPQESGVIHLSRFGVHQRALISEALFAKYFFDIWTSLNRGLGTCKFWHWLHSAPASRKGLMQQYGKPTLVGSMMPPISSNGPCRTTWIYH